MPEIRLVWDHSRRCAGEKIFEWMLVLALGGIDLTGEKRGYFERMYPRNCAGFTWVEVIVAIALIGILMALALPVVTTGSRRGHGQMTQTLSNLRQLHLATRTMALDGEREKNPALGWPGDIGGTFTNWVRQLVPAYLASNDFRKLSSAPGVWVSNGVDPAWHKVAFRVYAVDKTSSDAVVFLTSANFTNALRGGTPLDPKAKPYGDKGIVVFRKGGDGAILRKNQVTNTKLIGDYAPLCR